MLSFYKNPDKYIVLSSLQIIYFNIKQISEKQKLKIFNNYIKTPDIYV